MVFVLYFLKPFIFISTLKSSNAELLRQYFEMITMQCFPNSSIDGVARIMGGFAPLTRQEAGQSTEA